LQKLSMNPKNKRPFLLAAAFSLLVMASCSPSVMVTQEGAHTPKKNPLAQIFKNSDVLSSYFVGFELYDPQANKVIYAQNEKKYFTQASNTKLYTFYTGLKYLPDKLPALKYIIRGRSEEHTSELQSRFDIVCSFL